MRELQQALCRSPLATLQQKKQRFDHLALKALAVTESLPSTCRCRRPVAALNAFALTARAAVASLRSLNIVGRVVLAMFVIAGAVISVFEA
jgi:hypothetical protein